MSKTWKIIIAIVIVGFIAGAIMFYRLWFMPQRDVMDEIAVVTNAQQLFDTYSTDPQKANALYLDKALEVTGEVEEVGKNQQSKPIISLKINTDNPLAGVRCTMKDDITVSEGQQVTIKGRCTGYLMDVTMVDCYILK